MASITIEIRSNEDIRYSPSPFVSQGDTVTFRIVDIPGEVEVSFDGGNSCLTPPGPYYLNGVSLQASQESVSLTAPRGQYPFTVKIFGPGERKLGGELETKKGGIDVTTDPPKDRDTQK